MRPTVPQLIAILWLSACTPLPQVPNNQPISIIDLSHHNEVAAWDDVKNHGVSVVILKATDGGSYIDPKFVERRKLAKDLGFIVGAYHFYETNDTPEEQANWFIQNVDLRAGNLPPIIDIERIKKPIRGDLHQEFRAFLARLENHYGVKPIIYTGPNFWNHALAEHLPDYPLWIAQYETQKPKIPTGWSDWTMWQFTEKQMVAGINGPVDGSRFNGDNTDLANLVIGR
ncbi:MAG: glycoside hydrolase family 25 protein [Yoonia sp.]